MLMFTPTLCIPAQAAAIKHLGKAEWRVRLGVGCVALVSAASPRITKT
jgi:hypothetical protein